jgi:hypothetical protein
MAQMTRLDSKLGEVLGLAQAQGHVDAVRSSSLKLAGIEDPNEPEG